jgi:hypothetical protein
MDWLQDVGMVVNSLNTETMYFSKHDQVGLKIQVSSSEIQVVTTMRVLGVLFNSKLSWGSHITNISNIVKKKIHTLRKISADFNQSELISIAHGSIYSILYFAAGNWLNRGLQQKNFGKLKFLDSST